jgi:NAD(P)H dehydrogenase (quinone)
LLNFGFLVFGVTDYVSKLSTAHYGAVTARGPHEEGTRAVTAP